MLSRNPFFYSAIGSLVVTTILLVAPNAAFAQASLATGPAAKSADTPTASKSTSKKSASKKANPDAGKPDGDAAKSDVAAKSDAAPTETPAKKDEPSSVAFKAGDIWDVDIFKKEDHKVLVIQDRQYTKAKRFELGLAVGSNTNSAFYRTYLMGLQADYYFTEYMGIDLFGFTAKSSLSYEGQNLIDSFFKSQFDNPPRKEFQKIQYLSGLSFMWVPIYGKFAFFRRSIIHFDFFGTAGLSMQGMSSYYPADPTKHKYQTQPGTLLSVGMRVFLDNHFSLRLDVRNNIYKTKFDALEIVSKPENSQPVATVWRNAFSYTLGSSFIF